MFDEIMIVGMGLFIVCTFVHDVVIKEIYCAIKRKKGNKKRCYFWSCKYWRYCPYNGR